MGLRRTRLKPRNEVRAAKMRALNFPEPPVVPPWCLIAHELQRYQASHGEKSVPAGWSACWGPVDPAHVTPRGMGGVNSSKDDVVWLCRGHHGEQEGKTRAFEARYNVNLKAEAARIAAGGTEPGAPA